MENFSLYMLRVWVCEGVREGEGVGEGVGGID